jgi:uncharacterized membrane protein (DUF485 family)
MTTSARYERIRQNPNFQALCRSRDRLAWTLAGIVLVLYYGFVLLVAFGQDFLGQPLLTGSVTTIGLPIGVGVILCAIGTTAIYVWRANTYFDALTKKLMEETK